MGYLLRCIENRFHYCLSLVTAGPTAAGEITGCCILSLLYCYSGLLARPVRIRRYRRAIDRSSNNAQRKCRLTAAADKFGIISQIAIMSIAPAAVPARSQIMRHYHLVDRGLGDYALVCWRAHSASASGVMRSRLMILTTLGPLPALRSA